MESVYIVTGQQHLFFEQHGYLVITNGFTKEEIEQHKVLAKAVHNLPRTNDPCGYLQYDEINKKGERVLCRVENFAEAVVGFNSLLRGRKLIGIKFAGSGWLSPHVDRAGYGTFSNLEYLSVAIAIDPANEENGGMKVVPGSHKMEIPIGADKTLEKGWVKSQQRIPVNLNSVKMSGPNESIHDRRVLYATYNRAEDGDNHDAYYLDRKKRYPSTHHCIADIDYKDGSKYYACGTPMLTIEELAERTTAGGKGGAKRTAD